MASLCRWQLAPGISQKRVFSHERTKKTLLVRSRLEELTDLLKDKTTQVDTAVEQKAMSRLRSLLSSIQDTDEDVFSRFFQQVPTEYRMSVFLQFSTLALFSVLGICVICGMDPFGGMNIFQPDLEHGLLGFAAAIPPVLVRVFIWNVESIPVVNNYRDRKNQAMSFLFENMSFQDALIVLGLVTLCATFVIYPGIVGCFSSSMEAYSTIFNGPESAKGSFEAVLVTVSMLLGFISAQACSLSKEETETITNAASNSDRYYKLTIQSQDDIANAAEVHSDAFRKAVWNFINTNRQTCALAGALTFGETIYAGEIWKATSDLSTTLCFIFAMFTTDFLFYRSMHK
eukprot:g1025.t1